MSVQTSRMGFPKGKRNEELEGKTRRKKAQGKKKKRGGGVPLHTMAKPHRLSPYQKKNNFVAVKWVSASRSVQGSTGKRVVPRWDQSLSA